ncbi:bll3768 [Bradyrhizobium diazoefficiens USDA 110]|uniref:Bll3768 protein n=1 Tax=Bradyrhizobium diazoefficiens (strain JCM 10833 / BCRC 13528 / IAM 13628 / NBRC 14792 / USDA 110) TaxID=224911 RepID=Q89NR6_BRADU|nr:bll3768 [Bradyrhizobium diazoefficiens USDA 110]
MLVRCRAHAHSFGMGPAAPGPTCLARGNTSVSSRSSLIACTSWGCTSSSAAATRSDSSIRWDESDMFETGRSVSITTLAKSGSSSRSASSSNIANNRSSPICGASPRSLMKRITSSRSTGETRRSATATSAPAMISAAAACSLRLDGSAISSSIGFEYLASDIDAPQRCEMAARSCDGDDWVGGNREDPTIGRSIAFARDRSSDITRFADIRRRPRQRGPDSCSPQT